MKLIFDHSAGYVINDKVFCEVYCLPENETSDELLDLGWLPTTLSNVPYWYQSQSCRIDPSKIQLSYKRRKVISEINFEVLPYNSIKTEVDTYFRNFFEQKSFDINDSYDFNSKNPNLQVLILFHKKKIVGYIRFQSFEKNLLGYESSYDSDLSKLSLGKTGIIILSEYGKSIGKKYTYVFESYKNYFPYKLEISGVEYFEGEYWK